jgi:hypothetical protein
MYKVADGNNDHPMVRFHRTYFDQEKSSLEIIDESVMPSVDYIVREYISNQVHGNRFSNELYSHVLDHGKEEEGQAKVYVCLGLNSTNWQLGNRAPGQRGVGKCDPKPPNGSLDQLVILFP